MSEKMRTAKEWLALGDELPVKLAEVFMPGPWKHNIFIGSGSLPDFACKKCDWSCSLGAMACFVEDGIASKESGQYVLHQIENSRKRLIITSGGHQFKPECPVPAPIVIDWNTAMEWQRKYRPGYSIFKDIYMVVKKSAEPMHLYVIWKWIANMCDVEEARIRLIAAALAEGAKT